MWSQWVSDDFNIYLVTSVIPMQTNLIIGNIDVSSIDAAEKSMSSTDGKGVGVVTKSVKCGHSG